jgi:hypothetical protein
MAGPPQLPPTVTAFFGILPDRLGKTLHTVGIYAQLTICSYSASRILSGGRISAGLLASVLTLRSPQVTQPRAVWFLLGG